METSTIGVEIGIASSRALERGDGRGIGSTGIVSKVRVSGSGLSIVDGSGTACKALFRLVPWVVNCDLE